MIRLSFMKSQRGSALIPIVLTMPVLILITGYYMQLSVQSYRLAKTGQARTHAQLATDSGIDEALLAINSAEGWSGSGEVEIYNQNNTRVVYEATLVEDTDDKKVISTTGRTFWPADSTSPAATVTVQTELRPVRSGNYSIVTGVGGLYMSNSARILGGDVHVNGEIRMSNTSQIGLSSKPATVTVAHQNCPTPASALYPRVCNPAENGQPINISHPAQIYGQVSANNQTDGSRMSSPGLIASSGIAAKPLPPHDRAAQIAAVNDSASITGAAASCSSGTRTWPANIKITGNVSISNSCRVTAEGNVWVTGRLNLSNSGELNVSDSVGITRPNLMIDGSGQAFSLSNSAQLGSNSSSTGFQVITYWSGASCSPDCADVTGTDLYDSRDTSTIVMSNNTDAPHSILYARWSRVNVSNSGEIGALIGQTVQMNNSATITFGTSVSLDGDTFWVIDGYRRTFGET